MKLMIAGSRNIEDLDISPYIPKGVDLIITGGASGIDTLAEKYADKNRLSKLILRPRYDLYKRAAPLKRNEEMIKYADSILIFWDGISKGTEFVINKAKELNKEINIILINDIHTHHTKNC